VVFRKDGNVEIAVGEDDSMLAIAYGDDHDPLCWPVTANARLIAAAPEMAELLQILAGGKVTDRVVMSVEMDRQFKALSRARALLAKLEGKP
jgi:hypothetical protein